MKTYSDSYKEPSRELTVLDHADVLVIGGGPGGIGAAIAAARNGARTVLVERFGCLGGTWTSGILSAVMPFPFVKGIMAEIVRRWEEQPEGWHALGNATWPWGTYDTETAKRALDAMAVEAGVIPYFFTNFSDVIREGNRVTGIIVESKEGRQVIWARQVIDASGDGDVCVKVGVPFSYGRETDGGVQPMTMIFKVAGIDNEQFDIDRKEDPGFRRAWKEAKARGEVTVPREDVLCFPGTRKGEWNFNTSRIVQHDATKVRDVTAAMIEGRRQVGEIIGFLRRHIPSCRDIVLLETAPHIGVRESRRIAADYTVTADDIMYARPFEDAISRGTYFIDIHNPTGEGTVRIDPPKGKWYEIPYRSIRARGIDNLLIASRCIDSTHEAHAAIRVTPQVVAIGQGAGTAAALCAKAELASTRDLDPAQLRETLRCQGALV